MGLVDTFDGAQHLVTDEGITDVTSFSSLMFSNNSYSNGNSIAEYGNILTWKQVVGKEEPSNIISSVKTHYDEKDALKLTFEEDEQHV